jgi:pSer/pThr/pTyr-binding forkhead associated (FHA) protein
MAPATAVPLASPAAPSPWHPPAAPVRPAAPEVHFVPKGDAPQGDAVVCPHCGSQNQTTVRFCVTCGKSLAAPAAAAPRARGPAIDLTKTVPTPPPVHEPSLAAPAAPERGQALSPVRVVEVSPAPAAAPARACPRCGTPAEGSAQFCRLCGAALTEANVAPPPAPVPTAPAPPAPMPARAAPSTLVVAGTSSPARGSIVLVARDGGEGPAYPLGESTDIGRSEGNVLLTDDAYISPRHARITLRGQTYFLRDLGSTNGLYVRIPFRLGGPAAARGAADDASKSPPKNSPNETPEEQPLKDQDLFLVGQQVLRFEVVKDAEEGFGVASDNGTLHFGTPASPRYGRLVQRTVEGVARDVFYLRKTETILGRESGDIVFTDDPFLSRRHAVIRVNKERTYTLSDLGSSNGTFLKVHEEVPLQSGSQFRIGQQLFRFDLEAHP